MHLLDEGSLKTFLNRRPVQIVSAILVLQIGAFYLVHNRTKREQAITVRPLEQMPQTVAGWRTVQTGVVEEEVQKVLKADDTLVRTYGLPGAGGQIASLFIAFFKSQRTGVAPHSPKNCLPGSGWVPSRSDTVSIDVPGRPLPVAVNRYVVSKGDSKSIVVYWYQSHNRVIASEYAAKIYLVLDSIRFRRSDTAIVRIVVPIQNDRESEAEQVAVEFIQSIFQPVSELLPS